MKREEREQLLKDTLLYFAPKDRYVTDEEGNVYYREDVTLKAMELSEQPLPPAEGAAYDGMMFTISEDGINPLNEQPTTEGAEEINKMIGQTKDSISKRYNKNYWEILGDYHSNGRLTTNDFIDELLNEFTTLHAQKIADKMVEDMRKKLFSMRATKESMDKLSEADRLMMYGYHDCINEMLMWTKSRDSHANKAGE